MTVAAVQPIAMVRPRAAITPYVNSTTAGMNANSRSVLVTSTRIRGRRSSLVVIQGRSDPATAALPARRTERGRRGRSTSGGGGNGSYEGPLGVAATAP